jgi:hypothetical protein
LPHLQQDPRDYAVFGFINRLFFSARKDYAKALFEKLYNYINACIYAGARN